jgi:hypothetical protein
MREKNVKKDRKLKLMTEEAGLDETARKQAKDIAKMYEDRDRKALGARDHLVSQLEVTSDKYRTANGVMAALQVVRDVLGNATDCVEEISIAKTAATRMAGIAQDMAHKAGKLDPEDMAELGFADGQTVRVTTKGGSAEIPIEASWQTSRGYMMLPHHYGLKFEGETEGVSGGQVFNWDNMDEITGNPCVRFTPCRVEAV